MAHISLYLIALLSLSTSSNWAKLNQMPAEILGFYRLTGAFLILFVFLQLFQTDRLRSYSFKPQNIRWGLLSGFFFFLHLLTYKYAAKNTSISHTMILFSTAPVWASVGEALFFKKIISLKFIFSYLLAFSGLLIVFLEGPIQSINLDHITAGNYSALASAFLFAVYSLSGKKARETLQNSHFALIQYGMSAALFLVLALFNKNSFTAYSSISWLSVLGMILLPTFLGHFLFTSLLPHLSISKMTCGKLLEPPLASLMAYLIFSEKLSNLSVVAFFITSFSVILIFWPFQNNIKNNNNI